MRDCLFLKDNSSKKSWVVSFFMIGAAIVPWIASEYYGSAVSFFYSGDNFAQADLFPPVRFAAVTFPRIGKKWSLIALSLPFVAGWLLLCFASNYSMLLAGRFFTGFSGGAFVMAAPAYSSEIAETRYRGALGTLMQLMVCLGILFINLNCTTDWAVVSWVCLGFPALLALWMVFMPRSPQFLVSKGDIAAGRKSLQWLRGRQEVEEELAAITADLQQAEQIGTVRILRGKQNR